MLLGLKLVRFLLIYGESRVRLPSNRRLGFYDKICIFADES